VDLLCYVCAILASQLSFPLHRKLSGFGSSIYYLCLFAFAFNRLSTVDSRNHFTNYFIGLPWIARFLSRLHPLACRSPTFVLDERFVYNTTDGVDHYMSVSTGRPLPAYQQQPSARSAFSCSRELIFMNVSNSNNTVAANITLAIDVGSFPPKHLHRNLD
jgi:hypothetical protein